MFRTFPAPPSMSPNAFRGKCKKNFDRAVRAATLSA